MTDDDVKASVVGCVMFGNGGPKQGGAHGELFYKNVHEHWQKSCKNVHGYTEKVNKNVL